jgi:hypothetical protein
MKQYCDLTETQKKIFDQLEKDWINDMVKTRDLMTVLYLLANKLKRQLK